MSRLPTPGECIRRECLNCLGATSAGSAHDCMSALCELYPCHPFRGRRLPSTQRPRAYDEAAERERIAAHHKRRPRRQPSKAFIAKHCRSCQPETRADCEATDCALYPWRPWQPGGQPKRSLSPEERERRLVALERAHEKQKTPQHDGPHISGAARGTPGWGIGRQAPKRTKKNAPDAPIIVEATA